MVAKRRRLSKVLTNFVTVLQYSGVETDLAFTVKYAAPETIQAFKRGDQTEVGSASVDVWALGVRHSLFYSICIFKHHGCTIIILCHVNGVECNER